MKKHTCVLLIGDNQELNIKAISYLRKYFIIKGIIDFNMQHISEKKAANLAPEYVFNFLSDKILRGPLLKFKNVNFHPASPEWPGRGSASLALFHGNKYFGATAHIMDLSVDSGRILMVKRFPVSEGESCESVFKKGKVASLVLFKRAVKYIVKYGRLPEPCGLVWKRKPLSKERFQQWLILDPKNKKEFIKKVKASRHSKFPGPYVIVHGYKFGLVVDKHGENK